MKKAQKKLHTGVGEELLAYQTDPEQFKKTMKGADVSKEAIQKQKDTKRSWNQGFKLLAPE